MSGVVLGPRLRPNRRRSVGGHGKKANSPTRRSQRRSSRSSRPRAFSTSNWRRSRQSSTANLWTTSMQSSPSSRTRSDRNRLRVRRLGSPQSAPVWHRRSRMPSRIASLESSNGGSKPKRWQRAGGPRARRCSFFLISVSCAAERERTAAACTAGSRCSTRADACLLRAEREGRHSNPANLGRLTALDELPYGHSSWSCVRTGSYEHRRRARTSQNVDCHARRN